MRAKLLFLCFSVFFVYGCGGGSSGANGPDPFTPGTDPVVALSLALLDSNCNTVDANSFAANQDICVQATLTSDGVADSNEVVSFTLSDAIGALSNSTALTDSNGIAQVTITNSSLNTGATTVTATFGSSTASLSFEYVAASASGAPTVALSMTLDGVATNRFEVGDIVSVSATALDANEQPLADTIVSFTATGNGVTFSPESSLSNTQGIATTQMTVTDSSVGAHQLTAAITIDTVDYQDSQNFEVAPAVDQTTQSLSVAVLNAACEEVVLASFTTGETICVTARLLQGETPVRGEIINFSINGGIGDLSSATALTDVSGNAVVNITNASAAVGAASVVATYNSLTSSSNFEYVSTPSTVVTTPTVSVNLVSSGQLISRFQAGDDVRVQARVLTSSQTPVVDGIVNFAVQGTGPVLAPTTALTNSDGIAEVSLSATESDLGAYAMQVTTVVDNLNISNSMNFEVQSAGTVVDNSETRFGHFNSDGVFVPDLIGSSAEVNGEVTISAGATVGFNVALVDENDARILTPTPVTFSSNCVSNGQATIDGTVTTINGEASATFEDLNCAGSSGNTDQIVASVVINNTTLTITRQLNIQAEGIGSLSFVSASPDEIVLSGTGGQNSASVSTLTFQVNGELGNPLAQQEVSFALNTSTGGLSLDPATGLTNSAGQVSTRVTAGNVPTAVRVTASATGEGGEEIRTQSDLLSVNTGIPDQNSFSISTSNFNPEANSIDGISAEIRVRLADTFNNPVPNGTTVNFTTEGGQIEPSCTTGEDVDGNIDPQADNTGTCVVTWTSANPRTADHRITILATAIGHETLFDSNGNNAYDDVDGNPISDGTDSGFGVSEYGQNGFVDHSEAWRDDDEDGTRDNSEIFIDYNSDLAFNTADGLFNGPQCTSATMCGSGEAATLHVRKSLVMVMSSSEALWRVYSGDITNINNVVFTNDADVGSPNSLSVPAGQSRVLTLVYYDTADQVLASGTQLGFLDSDGNISTILDTVNNSTQRENPAVPGSIEQILTIDNTDGNNDTLSFQYVIQSPSGAQTDVEFSVIRQ